MENEDLITEILLRLPKRSLARFKAVSKQWLQNISSTCFKQNYASRNKSLFGFFYAKDNIQSPKIQFLGADSKNQHCFEKITTAPNVSYEDLYMKVSCNGLILCEARIKQFDELIAYLVYNPITGQFFRLPPPPIKPCFNCAGLGLAFDHSSNPPLLVVTQVFDNGFGGVQLDSFSSYTYGWSSKSYNLSERIHLTDSPFFNGRLHWRSKGPNIFAYDVRKERFSFIPKPVEAEICSRYNSRLDQSRDRLVYIQLLGGSEFTLWTLEDYYQGIWTLGYRTSMQVPRAYFIVGINPVDDRILYLNLTMYWYFDDDDYPNYSEEMYSYNLENGDARLLFQGCSTDAGKCPLLYLSPYEMPLSPSSIPPQCYFSALFGEFSSIGHGVAYFQTYGGVTTPNYSCHTKRYGREHSLSHDETSMHHVFQPYGSVAKPNSSCQTKKYGREHSLSHNETSMHHVFQPYGSVATRNSSCHTKRYGREHSPTHNETSMPHVFQPYGSVATPNSPCHTERYGREQSLNHNETTIHHAVRPFQLYRSATPNSYFHTKRYGREHSLSHNETYETTSSVYWSHRQNLPPPPHLPPHMVPESVRREKISDRRFATGRHSQQLALEEKEWGHSSYHDDSKHRRQNDFQERKWDHDRCSLMKDDLDASVDYMGREMKRKHSPMGGPGEYQLYYDERGRGHRRGSIPPPPLLVPHEMASMMTRRYAKVQLHNKDWDDEKRR